MVTTICFWDDMEATSKKAYKLIKPAGSVMIGFIYKNSPLGKLHQQYDKKSVLYNVATFHSMK
jgi:hypothetical protein